MKKLSVFAIAASTIMLCGCDQNDEKAAAPTSVPATVPATTSTEGASQTSSMNEVTSDPYTVDFTKGSWPGVVSKIEGLSIVEPWGTWSEGEKVVIEFTTPLPEKFIVHLTASVFGPNADKDFTMNVGNSSNTFRMAGQPEDKEIKFTNPNKSNILTISVPSPVSPKEIGFNEDTRKIGIGLIKLKVSAE